VDPLLLITLHSLPIPFPHPLAESTDISKAVRMDYGADVTYTRLMESALDGWRRWNERW
jgi:hypothetical protein